jgi:glutathione-specific gamma-glutamylcyclotransferase
MHTRKRPSPEQALRSTLREWRALNTDGFWVFAYASLIWRPEFDADERRPARVYGWHRSLGMWSTINRGTPEQPGLVFALQCGGHCEGIVMRMPKATLAADLKALWDREMPSGVYDPLWLPCRTPQGTVRALAFTLPQNSPRCCGDLPAERLANIFANAQGRYGSTRDYAMNTLTSLQANGIQDARLHRLLRRAGALD